MITAKNLKKAYGARTVLDIASLELREGGRYALLGPNGSGKSTLLRMLAGQLRSDAADAALIGCPMAEVAYLPQTAYAFDRSVWANVMLPLGRGAEAERAAARAIARVGLTALTHARASRLSGGEKQRLALARVIAAPHRLLLLDEPTAAVDIEAEEHIEAALREYCGETGCTLLMSTHAPGQALRLATDVLVLSEGRLTEQGEVKTVFDHPTAESTKRFFSFWKG